MAPHIGAASTIEFFRTAVPIYRIVRFRNAANDMTRRSANWADFALDHGYYDHAHFINEFRELYGVTPTEYATVFSNTQPGATP